MERIVRQYAENEHRTDLTTTDRLGGVEKLSLLNVSAAQIANRSRMSAPMWNRRSRSPGPTWPKAASVRYDLTIDQAAGVAEFEDDTETVKALVAARSRASSRTCWSGRGRTAMTRSSVPRPRPTSPRPVYG